MRRATLLMRVATAIALLWSAAASAEAAGFERIEAQCQAQDGATIAARLLPDGTVSRFDGATVSRVSAAVADGIARDLDRIDFDRLPSDPGLVVRTRNYCLLTRAGKRDTHAIWIDPASATGRRRAALGVVTRILDLAG